MSCSGVKLSGPRKGEPCGSVANYAFRGNMYCAAHRTIAAAAPAEFTAAKESYYRRLGKEQARVVHAALQMDLFDGQ